MRESNPYFRLPYFVDDSFVCFVFRLEVISGRIDPRENPVTLQKGRAVLGQTGNMKTQQVCARGFHRHFLSINKKWNGDSKLSLLNSARVDNQNYYNLKKQSYFWKVCLNWFNLLQVKVLTFFNLKIEHFKLKCHFLISK